MQVDCKQHESRKFFEVENLGEDEETIFLIIQIAQTAS